MSELNDSEKKKLTEIAKLLGRDFNAADDSMRHRDQISFEGFHVFVYKPWRGLPQFVAGVDAPYQPHAHSAPSIGMNLDRPVRALVSDFKRRLLDDAKQWAASVRESYVTAKRREIILAEKVGILLDANACTDRREFNGLVQGKGLQIKTRDFLDYKNRYSAEVCVHSIEAMKLIAKICKEDFEFHSEHQNV